MTEEVLSLNRFVFDVRTVMVTLDMTYGLWNMEFHGSAASQTRSCNSNNIIHTIGPSVNLVDNII